MLTLKNHQKTCGYLLEISAGDREGVSRTILKDNGKKKRN